MDALQLELGQDTSPWVNQTANDIFDYGLYRSNTSSGTYDPVDGFYDSFTATDSNKYDIGAGVSINNEKLRIVGPASRAWGSHYYVTKQKYSRGSGFIVETDAKGVGSKGDYMFGVFDTGTGHSYTDMVYAFFAYPGHSQFYIYEDGSSRGAHGPTLSADTTYNLKISVKPQGGAKYFVNDVLIYDSTHSTENNLRVGYTVAAQTQDFDNLKLTPLIADNNYTDTSAQDVSAPDEPADLQSTSHSTSTWSSDPTVDISWTDASDNGDDYFYYIKAFDDEGNENNILSYGTIERGTLGSTVPGWGSNLKLNDTYAYAGSYSGVIVKLDAGELTSRHDAEPIPDNTIQYRYGGCVYSDGPSADIYFFSSSTTNFYDGTYDHITTTTTNKWVCIEGTSTNVVPTDNYLTLRVDNNGGGTVWFENLFIYPVKNTTVITNLDGYSFVCDASEGTLPDTTKDIEDGVQSHTCSFNEGQNNYFHLRSVDNIGNWNGTAVEIGPFWIDISSPIWSQNKTNPSSPTTYNPGKSYQFNITWTDSLSGVDEVVFEFDGTNHSYKEGEVSKSGDEYYITLTDLAANPSGYSFKWYANDSAGNWASSDQWLYKINKKDITPYLHLALNDNENNLQVTYGETSNATGWSTLGNNQDLEYRLYRDTSASYTSGDPASEIVVLGGGYHNYVYNTSGGENYTSGSSPERTIQVQKAACGIDMWLNNDKNTNKLITYGTQANSTAVINVSQASPDWYLQRNGSQKDSDLTSNILQELTYLSAGYYNYTAYWLGNENYTQCSRTQFLTVGKASSDISLTILPSDTVTYPTETTVWCNITVGDSNANITIWRNGTQVARGEGNQSYVATLGGGVWNFTCDYEESQNYTGTDVTSYLTVNKAPTETRLWLNGTRGDNSYNYSQVANFTVVLNVSGKTVYLNSNMTGWVLQSGVTPLYNYTNLNEVGVFNITGYFPGDQNYSSSSETHYANVQDFINPLWRNQGQNSSTIGLGDPILLYAQGKDKVLDYAWLETNETGLWQNKSTYSSPMDMNDASDTWTWSNFTWSNSSITSNKVIGWRIYYNDTSGNENVTDIMTFEIDVIPPTITIDNPKNITYGTNSINLNVTTSSNADWCGYNLDDTGSNTSLSGSGTNWNYQMTGVSDGTHQLFIYCNDTYGNMGLNDTLFFIVDTNPPSIIWVSPTPPNDNVTQNDFVYLNATVNDVSNTSAFFDWNHSLVGYWSMDYYNSTGIYDNSSYNNFGTFNGGLGTDNITTGKYGQALEFDEIGDYVDCGNDVSLKNLTSYTFDAWLNMPNPGSNYDPIFFKESGSASDIEIYGGNGGITIAHNRNNDGTFKYVYANNIPANQWVHYVVTYTSGTLKIYINGVNDQTFTGWPDPLTHQYYVDIGRITTFGTYYFNGTIDEVRIYNRALSPEEINASYNNGLYRLKHNFTSLSGGTYDYRAFAIDTGGNMNKTDWRNVTIDEFGPNWSLNTTSPLSPATYSPGASYQFNITWIDDMSTVDKVIFEFNGVNHTYPGDVSKSGDEYYITLTDLMANPSGYSYKWYANDTGNNWNSSDQWLYKINKANPSGSISGSDVTYPSPVNTNPSESNGGDSDVNYTLWRNDTLVSSALGTAPSPDTSLLAADLYHYVLNSTEGENYTANSSIYILDIMVNKGTLSLDISGGGTWTYPHKSTVHGVDNNQGDSDVTYELWRNITKVDDVNPYWDNVTLGVSYYLYRFNGTGGENWTANPTGVTTFVNITQNTSTHSYMNLTINETESNKEYEVGTTSNATGWFDSSSFVGSLPTFTLYNNTTSIGSSNPISDIKTYTSPIVIKYTYNTSGNQNYSSASKSYILKMVDTTPPIYSQNFLQFHQHKLLMLNHSMYLQHSAKYHLSNLLYHQPYRYH